MQGHRVRIGLLIETDGPGGAESVVLQLARALRDRDHEVLAVGPEEGEGWLSSRLLEAGFERETVPLRGPTDLRSVRGLASIFRRHRLDVVHSHEFTMAFFGALAARATGRRHVITMHGGAYFTEARRRVWALKTAAALSAKTVAVSENGRRQLADALGMRPDRFEVVHNGTLLRPGDPGAVRSELGLRPSDRLLLAVGNLYPVKGHDVLISALSRVPAPDGGRVVLAIAGRGEQEDSLRALAVEAGLSDNVKLLGFRSDVPDLLAAADLFVMPSRSEGLPMAIIEAMLTGVPVVATRVGGVHELIPTEDRGVLVPPEDPAALAAAIGPMVTDDSRRTKTGAAGREWAEARFSGDAMTRGYLRLYGAG